MVLSELFTEREKILHGKGLGRILDRVDEGQGREAGFFDVRKIDGGGRTAKIGDARGEGSNQCSMSLRRRSLLQLVESHMNVLQPFVRLLNKEIDELFLKFI